MKPKKTTVKKTKTKVVAKGIKPIKKVAKKKLVHKSSKLNTIKARLLGLAYLKEKEKELFGDKYVKKINDWM